MARSIGIFLLSAESQRERLGDFPDLKLTASIAVASGSALEYCVFGNECAKPWELLPVRRVERRAVDLVQLLRHRALLPRRLRQGSRQAQPMLQKVWWPGPANKIWRSEARTSSGTVRDTWAQRSAAWLSSSDPWLCPNAECVASTRPNYGNRNVCRKCGVWKPRQSTATLELWV